MNAYEDVRFGSPSAVRLVESMLHRLRYEPKSLWRSRLYAESEGTDVGTWFGWDYTSARLADVVDLLDLDIRATAQRKAAYKKIAPRPVDSGGKGNGESRNTQISISLKNGVGGLPRTDPLAGAVAALTKKEEDR